MDFLVIMRMRDPLDPAVQQRRAAARPDHLAGAARLQEQGHLLIGGAIFLDDGTTPAGSAAVARFDTREALDAWLREDPYTKAGVWESFESRRITWRCSPAPVTDTTRPIRPTRALPAGHCEQSKATSRPRPGGSAQRLCTACPLSAPKRGRRALG